MIVYGAYTAVRYLAAVLISIVVRSNCVIFFRVYAWLVKVLGQFSIIYFGGLGSRIGVRVWVRVRVFGLGLGLGLVWCYGQGKFRVMVRIRVRVGFGLGL